MTVVESVSHITSWVQRELCDPVRFKKPPDNLKANDANYQYELATPKAFSFFVPQSDLLPDGGCQHPFACVRLTDGADRLPAGDRKLNIEIIFATWSPGHHKSDMFRWTEGGLVQQEDAPGFSQNGEGWNDVWNWIDVAVRKVETASKIGELVTDPDTPVTFGPLTEQDEIVTYYPFWYAWVRFGLLDYTMNRNMKEHLDFF